MSPSKHQVVIWILGTLIFEHFYKLEDALITSEMSLKSEHMLIPDICHESHEYTRVNFFWPV